MRRVRFCLQRRSSAALLIGVVVAALAGAAHAGDYGKVYAEGLRHSRRAASLAGANNCKAAIPEYTKAIKMLKDPVLLFNRAECYRTVGKGDAAVTDYRQFLHDLPKAPNRAQVEAQIAALETAAKPSAPVAAAPVPVVPAETPAVAKPAAPEAAAPQPGDALSPRSSSQRAPIIGDAGDDPQKGAPVVVPAAEPPAAPSLSPENLEIVRGDAAAMPLTRSESPAPAPEAHRSIVTRWWFWTIAAVLVGGGVASYFALRSEKTDIPPSKLGNYRF
jgi:hypothetical protein